MSTTDDLRDMRAHLRAHPQADLREEFDTLLGLLIAERHGAPAKPADDGGAHRLGDDLREWAAVDERLGRAALAAKMRKYADRADALEAERDEWRRRAETPLIDHKQCEALRAERDEALADTERLAREKANAYLRAHRAEAVVARVRAAIEYEAAPGDSIALCDDRGTDA